MRKGPAKRMKGSPPATVGPDSGSDGWGHGGIEFHSEFEEDDAELSQFLQANTSFLLTVTKTAGLTDLQRHFSKHLFLLVSAGAKH